MASNAEQLLIAKAKRVTTWHMTRCWNLHTSRRRLFSAGARHRSIVVFARARASLVKVSEPSVKVSEPVGVTYSSAGRLLGVASPDP
jgi:hypothetical protein